jgi:small ligand-binding sensory domain FIST
MIRAGSGLAQHRDPVEAALEAALMAQERLGLDHAHTCVVFATAGAYGVAHGMLHAVRRATGARGVVGCSGAGVLTERVEYEVTQPAEDTAAVAVLAIASDELRITPFVVDETEGLGSAAGTVAGARAFEGTQGVGLIVVLPDAKGLQPGEMLQGVRDAGGPMPIVGGVAAGSPIFELYNTDALQGAMTGLALCGRKPVIGVAQACEPVGEPFVITRGEDNMVREIAGRPALAVLQQALEDLPGGPARLRNVGVFAGLAINPAKSPLERGDFLVRSLLGADQKSGAIALAESIHVGQTIQFQIRDARAAAADLAETLGGVRTALGGRRPAFGLYFNCAGRGQGLFGEPNHDVKLIRERLGDLPMVGFFGNGEFAPVGGRNFFHTYTGVLVIVPESDELS